MTTTRQEKTARNSGRRNSRNTPRSSQSKTGSLRVEHVPLDQLRPWDGNPRHIPSAEMESLRQSLSHWGLVQPIIVRREDSTIIGGHQRLEAARALGMKRVPVVYLDISAAEAKALNLALNRISGEWDLPKLGGLLQELQDLPDLDESLTGFDADEIDAMLADLERQSAPDPREETFPDAAEALQTWMQQTPTRVSKGDLWRLGRHRLFCGDSLASGVLERLCEDGRVDIVLTDPPYGIDYQSSQPSRGKRKRRIANDAADDFEAFLERALPAIRDVMRRGATLYWFAGGGGAEPVLGKAQLAISRHFNLLNTLVWDKVDPGLGWRWRRSWEAIVEASSGRPKAWHGGTDRRNVLRYPRAIPQSDDHPTPKPIPLLEEIIRSASPARGCVLDPFAGSGSTLIAAERTGRSCLVAELEPRYCDMILARWEALTHETAARA